MLIAYLTLDIKNLDFDFSFHVIVIIGFNFVLVNQMIGMVRVNYLAYF